MPMIIRREVLESKDWVAETEKKFKKLLREIRKRMKYTDERWGIRPVYLGKKEKK